MSCSKKLTYTDKAEQISNFLLHQLLVAFYSPIALVNDANTSAGDVVISLSGRKIKSATGFRTSGDENHVQLADEDVQFSRDRVSVALPKYSFVTLQIEHR